MKDNVSFRRKVFYLSLMAFLLVPLYLISAPSFMDANGQLSEGGLLTREREEHGLAQANLGDIDPTSESMKLATLGMRGIAANLLWEKANEYKKKEQWDNLSATLNQIAKLQPNFISVWRFQAWNLSYNVSVEFDNYEHRYHWVKKGIDFMMQGIRYNRNEPRLLWDLGWFFGHKIGRSDEYRQFRREFRKDEDFHRLLPLDIDQIIGPLGPDNWLAAYQWFAEAQRVVDMEGVPIRGTNPLVFHSDKPKSLIRFGDAIEEEGILDEKAQVAWERALREWMEYGNRDIPTSWGYKILLNDGERWVERVAERKQALADLLPGLEEKMRAERLAKLTPEERDLLGQVKGQLSAEDYEIVIRAERAVEVTPDDLAAAAPADKRREAKRLANRILEAEAHATTVRRYRDVVNFIYWRTRCEVEMTTRAIEARRFLYEADQRYRESDFEGAREKYEAAWDRWAEIHEEYPALTDDASSEDLVDALKRYRVLLVQGLDQEFPPPGFKMLRLIANHAEDFGISNEEAREILASLDGDKQAGEPDAKDDANAAPADANEDGEQDDRAGAASDAVDSAKPAAADAEEIQETVGPDDDVSTAQDASDAESQSD